MTAFEFPLSTGGRVRLRLTDPQPCAHCGKTREAVEVDVGADKPRVPWCGDCFIRALAIALVASLPEDDRQWVMRENERKHRGT